MTVRPLPSRHDRKTCGPRAAPDLPAQAVSARGLAKAEGDGGA